MLLNLIFHIRCLRYYISLRFSWSVNNEGTDFPHTVQPSERVDILIKQHYHSIFSINGHSSDNLHTYGMVQGMIGCGFSLGSTIGPVFSGAVTDAFDYASVGTILAGVNLIMVGETV